MRVAMNRPEDGPEHLAAHQTGRPGVQHGVTPERATSAGAGPPPPHNSGA
jgi:hypothetical protein